MNANLEGAVEIIALYLVAKDMYYPDIEYELLNDGKLSTKYWIFICVLQYSIFIVLFF